MIACAFAIPGDPETVTGGYRYDRDLIGALRAAGRTVRLIRTGASFPHPTPADHDAAIRAFRALPQHEPLIVDGLIFGALETEAVSALRAPLIAMLHHPLGLEAGLPPDRARAMIARERANLQRAAHVVVPSPHVARLLTAEFGLASDAISVALPGFHRPAAPRRPKDEPPLILSVGLICARKGHDLLIDALARIDDLGWRAVIAGLVQDPALAASLRAQVDRLGLAGRVELAGCVPDAALQDLYARASIFALATRYEGYGMVFGEALLNGLPIVSCATGAVPDTVPDAAGILVPPENAQALSEALRRLLVDPGARACYAEAARQAGARLPGWDAPAAIMRAAVDRAASAARG